MSTSADDPARSRAWRAFMGEFALPTLLLATAVVAAHRPVWWAVRDGRLGWGLAVLAQVILAYVSFTPMHEAAHGNVAGSRSEHRWVDALVGWACGVLLFAPFPAFRHLHLKHHAHTNDPERDPDFFVAARRPLAVVARCFVIMPHYYWEFLVGPSSRARGFQRERPRVLIAIGLFVLTAVVLTATGLGREVLLLWLLPAFLASGLLAFAFDWLPHHPHDVQGRYLDTRVILFPGLELLLLWQNYHLIHHLYPRVPFYRYGQCFRAMRGVLRHHGAPVVDLRASASSDAP